jgi:hypothetical protein
MAKVTCRTRFHSEGSRAETAEQLVRNIASGAEIWLPGIVEDANYEFSISLLPITPIVPKIRKRNRDRAEALRLAAAQNPP